MTVQILTVDDSPSMRKLISVALTAQGFAVAEAVDGADGLAKARTQRFDLVISDQNMPNMDGITFVSHLKQLPAYRSTPVLMLSSDSSDDLKARARAAGAIGWMIKPFDQAKLISAVARLVQL